MDQHQLPERNPKTHAQHRKEVFWQIALPLIIGIMLILAAIAAIIFSALQPSTGVSRWADVSLMWLILPTLFFAFILLALLVAVGYGITFLLHRTPRYARVVQLYFETGRDKVSQLTNLITKPIIKTQSAMAVLHRIVNWRRPPKGEG